MNTFEPSAAEIVLTRLVGRTFAVPFYRRYIESLPLQGDERILDFGSGSGLCSIHLARRLQNGGELTCVDISRRWAAEARRTLRFTPRVRFLVGELSALGLPGGHFDGILIHFVLHDLPTADRPGILLHLARVLRPGGAVFLREPVGRGAAPSDQIIHLLESAGMHLLSRADESHWFTGPILSASFVKP